MSTQTITLSSLAGTNSRTEVPVRLFLSYPVNIDPVNFYLNKFPTGNVNLLGSNYVHSCCSKEVKKKKFFCHIKWAPRGHALLVHT